VTHRFRNIQAGHFVSQFEQLGGEAWGAVRKNELTRDYKTGGVPEPELTTMDEVSV
jgi:hypothetical protein